jgi:CHRD domain
VVRRFLVATALAALAALLSAPAVLAQEYDYGDSSGTANESSNSSQTSSSDSKWVVLATTLSGAAEVPGPGDPDGTGRAVVKLKDGQACWDLSWSNISAANLGHIHKGAKGVAGPVVVTFFGKAPAVRKGCTEVDEALVDQIAANPAAFYVNIHNADHPKGAIRGQLAKSDGSLPFTGPGDSSQRLLWIGALITIGGLGLLIVTRRLGVGRHLATAGRHLARH